MVIFHSYVSLPDGNYKHLAQDDNCTQNPMVKKMMFCRKKVPIKTHPAAINTLG
jgi:hypothetical protein